jgi:serine/threonine protein kinase
VAALQPGAYLGQYRIEQPIGSGGMAYVYLGYHEALDRPVAVKVLPANFAMDSGFVNRFRNEARTIARLRHPQILEVYDFGEQDGLTYIVMEYISGGTLDTRLRPRLPYEFVTNIVNQMAAGLDYAHQRGVLHRDIKPRNILMTAEDSVVIADFGIAKITESTHGITQTGTILGTPEYMAPEQALSKPLDARCDVYSLGVIIYQMMVGRVPFQEDSALSTIMAHVHDPLPAPRSINSSIPESVEAVLTKSLAKLPDDRYSSAGELARALQAAVSELRTAAPTSNAKRGRRKGDTDSHRAVRPIESVTSSRPPTMRPPVPPPVPNPNPAAPAAPVGRKLPVPALVATAVLVLLAGLVVALGPWRGGGEAAGTGGTPPTRSATPVEVVAPPPPTNPAAAPTPVIPSTPTTEPTATPVPPTPTPAGPRPTATVPAVNMGA